MKQGFISTDAGTLKIRAFNGPGWLHCLLVALIGLSLMLNGCSSSSSGGGSDPDSDKSISEFSFKATNNPELTSDVSGSISGSGIAVTLPYGSDVTNLIATFTTSGKSVGIGSSDQLSGTTENDFSSLQTYTVTAADGTTQDYTITVSVSSSQGPTAYINPSRTSCTAPGSILFEGTGSIDALGRSIDSNSLQDNDIIDYSWDFGDGAENDVSSGGRYFNGFNGGHVYETPGTYTVTLTVTDTNGVSHSAETDVVISDFTGEIYCFSSTGDFTDCPSAGIQITTDYWSGVPGDNTDVLDYAAPNRRLLLKRGDTFTFQEPSTMGDGPLLISAMGTGEKPKVQYNGPARTNPQDFAPIYLNGENVSVSDIDFGLRNGDNIVNARGGGHAENLLLLRVDFDSILSYTKLMFVVDSTLKNETGNPSYAHAEKFVVLNNDFGPSTSHSVYGGHQDKAIFSGNSFHDVSNSGRTGLRLAANDGSSKNIIVTNNSFYNLNAYAIQFVVTTHVAAHHIVKNVLTHVRQL